MSEGCDSSLLAEVPTGHGQSAAWCRVSVVYALVVKVKGCAERRRPKSNGGHGAACGNGDVAESAMMVPVGGRWGLEKQEGAAAAVKDESCE